jgi:hypothetical protein
MMRKFTTCLFISCSTWLFLSSCNDDEASTPPKTSFTVDKFTGDANETEFTFVIDEVNAKSISLLPYGADKPSLGGILVENFENGKATVKFKYAQVGTFEAVVVTNNHTGDGEVKNTYSDTETITIGSDQNELKDFSFEKSTKTDVVGNDFTVTVPALTDITTLKGIYTASPFSTVTVNGVVQSSGGTPNNFSSPVTYVVTSDRGPAASYTVTVVVTPVETVKTIKSISNKVLSTAAKDKAFSADVDNANGRIVAYSPYGVSTDIFDSTRVGYALDGSFAILKYNGKKVKQDSLLDLTTTPQKQIVVWAQDSSTAAYDIYIAEAPKLELKFNQLNPAVTGVTSDFGITVTVLDGTPEVLTPTSTITEPAGVNVLATNVIVNDAPMPFVSGVTPVDFDDPVVFELTVNDANLGFTYTVRYTVTVVIVP